MDFIQCFFKILEWFVLITLLIISMIYVKDVWQKYQSKDTSIKVDKKSLRFMKNPTITLCFDPIIKPSTLKKYNFIMGKYNSKPNTNIA